MENKTPQKHKFKDKLSRPANKKNAQKGCGIIKEQTEKSHKSENTKFCTGTENVNRKRKNLDATCNVKRKKGKRFLEQNKEILPKTEDDKTSESPCETVKERSKRQIKKEKAELREVILKDKSRSEATQKALNYISKWKYDRTNWKFEKLRQIWLMEHLLQEKSIPNGIFPIVLEYFSGCKGMARDQLIKKSMNIIKKAEDEENDEFTMSAEYVRARQLIQVLPTKE